VQEWAADGLLAIFFFVVGLELKEELVAGTLRNPREAAVPIAALSEASPCRLLCSWRSTPPPARML
jgi:Na+/H+ antiporter NhaA